MTEDRKLERNPLEEPAPEGVIKQIEQFAYDLAWGVNKGLWGLMFRDSKDGLQMSSWTALADYAGKFRTYIIQKWNEEPPTSGVLTVSGYMEEVRYNSMPYKAFCLTGKALDLLDKPVKSPKIFVSYRRQESSALAVLVETRLKLQDQQIGVFTDKDIPLGDDWAERLEKSIVDCEYFICLISKDTLSSEWVRKEIDWALESGSQIISICHSGYDLNTTPENESTEEKLSREKLLRWQYHLIREENAKEYHSAMTELVRNLGYSTL